jgi:hypothetical protein
MAIAGTALRFPSQNKGSLKKKDPKGDVYDIILKFPSLVNTK